MTLDPRTPVIIGGGQVNERDGGVEPVDLVVAAARAAAQEANAPRVLELVDSVRIVKMLSWRYRDPGRLVGERIGAEPRHTAYTGNGGNGPQTLINGAAEDIAAGRCSTAIIGGAESWRTRMKLRAQGERPSWTVQDDSTPPADMLVPEVPMTGESESRIGLDRPAYVYPLFEQALRISGETSVDEHRGTAGALWASFSKVAATNRHAWTQREFTRDEIVTPSADNRWVSWPYTKLMNSNNMVDQGAVVLLCSAEVATSLGIPREYWVFPQAGTEAHDTYDIINRGQLDTSPAIQIAGSRALELSGTSIDEIAHVDVYSCFPSAVQVAAHSLSLPLNEPDRPLTVTGGLTFAGGPWNNYTTHAIATMSAQVRESPGSYGLVTANGGYLTKHAVGVYSTEPPSRGFLQADVQPEVDAQPKTRGITSYDGIAKVESWTVVHDRSQHMERAFLSARLESGERTLATTTNLDAMQRMECKEIAGERVRITSEGEFQFADD